MTAVMTKEDWPACRICDLPTLGPSVGGSDVCGWCDSGYWRCCGEKWTLTETLWFIGRVDLKPKHKPAHTCATPPPDAPSEAELHALDHPDECCSPTNCCGNDYMTQGEAEAKEMQEQTSEYRRMT